jgi:hypothetical protein
MRQYLNNGDQVLLVNNAADGAHYGAALVQVKDDELYVSIVCQQKGSEKVRHFKVTKGLNNDLVDVDEAEVPERKV